MKKPYLATIIIILVIGTVVYAFIYSIMKTNRQLNDFCKELGYDKMTDKQNLWFGEYNVECDDNVMYAWECRKETSCKKYNKWGDCSNNEFILDCTNHATWGDNSVDSWIRIS